MGTHLLATLLGKKLTDVRKSGLLWWLRPDGKTQVTIEYLQKADGSVEPRSIHTVVISTQHAEHGADERTHRERGDREVFGGDHAEKWQARRDPLRAAHELAHQPVREVHHWRSPR